VKTAEDIIISPYITEKSNDDVAEGKYTFIVDKKATKVEIRQAVEKLFSVKVLKVYTMNYRGKKKRRGVIEGRTSHWKKAIVKIDTEAKPEIYLTEGGKEVISNRKYKTEIEDFGFSN
jgi:large subunit ribosomal protein L23